MTSADRIHHHLVSESGRLVATLQSIGYPPEKVQEWLHWGAIYVNGVRQRFDLNVEPGQVIRVHSQPKRYHWEPCDLRDRIVYEDDDLLVFDKPAGLPVHATLDNYLENAKHLLENELKIPIYSTHRLDIPTQGLLLFAKSKSTQTHLNRLFSHRKVQKIYHAITASPVSRGEYVLYLNPETRVPREYSFAPREGWWECRLIIEASETHPFGYCQRISLETGKTHQIRAQLAALGAPILGDVLYGSTKNYVHERLALESYSLSFTYRSRTLAFIRPRSISLTVPLS